MRKMKENGLARKIGFSFHEKAELLKEVLDKYFTGNSYLSFRIYYANKALIAI